VKLGGTWFIKGRPLRIGRGRAMELGSTGAVCGMEGGKGCATLGAGGGVQDLGWGYVGLCS